MFATLLKVKVQVHVSHVRTYSLVPIPRPLLAIAIACMLPQHMTSFHLLIIMATDGISVSVAGVAKKHVKQALVKCCVLMCEFIQWYMIKKLDEGEACSVDLLHTQQDYCSLWQSIQGK